MTSLPAEKLELKNKGRIEENFDVDITIFDLENILDRVTYENPRQFPSGIEWYWLMVKSWWRKTGILERDRVKSLEVDKKRFNCNLIY